MLEPRCKTDFDVDPDVEGALTEPLLKQENPKVDSNVMVALLGILM